jgi:hypothetical protein
MGFDWAALLEPGTSFPAHTENSSGEGSVSENGLELVHYEYSLLGIVELPLKISEERLTSALAKKRIRRTKSKKPSPPKAAAAASSRGGYGCLHCPKKSRNRAQMVKHVRVHTGEKPFQCDQCAKGFAEKSNL